MPQMTKKFVLTKEGLATLQQEYDQLIKVKRQQITSRIQSAREFGDLSENSEYDAAKDEQSLLEHRITQLEEVLHRAEVAKRPAKTEFVVIGSKVVVEMNDE